MRTAAFWKWCESAAPRLVLGGPLDPDEEQIRESLASFEQVWAAAKEAERLRDHSDQQHEGLAQATEWIARLGTRIEKLEGLLREIREELDQEADVDDGTPNLAARLLVMIDGAALREEAENGKGDL